MKPSSYLTLTYSYFCYCVINVLWSFFKGQLVLKKLGTSMHDQCSHMVHPHTQQANSRFWLVFIIFGIWLLRSGGVSHDTSPKLDRTLSILIISASTRGLTSCRLSSSKPSLWGSGEQRHTLMVRMFQKSPSCIEMLRPKLLKHQTCLTYLDVPLPFL